MSLQDLNIPFYPAASSNYTKGRGRVISKITIHHMASQPDTLRYLWADPTRNGSSHFGVFPDKIEQYVQIGDTAWCNGNWASNQESITIENWGDWRNGFVNTGVIANLKKLLRELRRAYPAAQLTFHQDVSDAYTQCPAELRGYAQNAWNELTQEFAPPVPVPAPSTIKYEVITPKRIQLTRNANLWNFAFNKWSDAQAVKDYPAGTVIDVVAVATNALGGKYYMTAYSYNGGQVRATNGFNTADCKDYVEPTPAPVPTPTPPVSEPVKPTPVPVPEPVPTPPVNTDPETPADTDVIRRLNILELFMAAIKELLKKIGVNI